MATFIQGFEPNTSTDGADLLITDTSVYDDVLSKSVFTSRTVTVTKTDSTTEDYDFPYDDLDPDVQDVLTIANFFDQDYYLTIEVVWEFDNEGDADTATKTLDYISNYNSLICFVNLADDTDCSCSCESSTTLTTLNNHIETAILWAKFGNGQKAQKFLDKCKDICDALDNCDCN